MLLTANKPRIKERPFNDIITLLERSGAQTDSGVYVNSVSAMRQATVWACVRIVSEIIGQLPIEVHTRKNGAWVESVEHPMLDLLAMPNDWQTQHDLISTLVHWSELQGNGYLFKIRAGDRIARLMPLESDHVTVDVQKDYSLLYTATDENGGISGQYKADRIFHLRNFGSRGFVGLSTIGNHREGIALALQLEQHAVKSYKNSLQSNKWVKLETALKDDSREAFKAALGEFTGAVNAGKMPYLANAEIKEFQGMSAVDAQYIESRRLQKQEIAAIFGVPLFLINDTEKSTTWGTGLEQLSRSFVRFSLNPRLNRLGQTLIRELIPERERATTKIVFDTDQFTLGEFKERMDGYKSGIESGVLSPNECREIEGRNPRAGGDDYRQPLNIGTEGQMDESQAV